MANSNLTPNEIEVLKTITYSDFYENGRDSIVWDFSVLDYLDMTPRTRSGVFSSLEQKGYINVTHKEKKFIKDEKGNRKINPYYSPNEFGTYQITTEGYKVLDQLNLIDENGYFIEE